MRIGSPVDRAAHELALAQDLEVGIEIAELGLAALRHDGIEEVHGPSHSLSGPVFEDVPLKRLRHSPIEVAMTHEELLDRYAQLAVRSGLNLQKGQQLLITAPLDAVPLVRAHHRTCLQGRRNPGHRLLCRRSRRRWRATASRRTRASTRPPAGCSTAWPLPFGRCGPSCHRRRRSRRCLPVRIPPEAVARQQGPLDRLSAGA